MPKRIYIIVAVLILIGMVGFVGAQITGTKPAGAAVSAEKKEVKKPTLEERVETLAKNQQKILAELKEIKQNQEEILQQTNKIFANMKRK
jgi:prefoldin subunit 5